MVSRMFTKMEHKLTKKFFSIGMLTDGASEKRDRERERETEKAIIFGCSAVGCKIFAFFRSIRAKGFGIKPFFVVTTLGWHNIDLKREKENI